MARRVNFIEEINSTKDTWKIKVRVIGLWRVDRSSAPSLTSLVEVATTNVLIDVIGEFIDIEMSQPESMSKKVVFDMRDQRGNTISCTLWGQFALQLLKYERNNKFGPIVVILTLAKIREAKSWALENHMSHTINA
ncbi:hypothetical protein Lal_00027868 [Lupinus albus]|nr:hypothetical protein Lal_00027868 [Lupinus albus]